MLKQFIRRKVQHTVFAKNQFFGNTVRQKGFSDTGISVDKQIASRLMEMVDKVQRLSNCKLCMFERGFAGLLIPYFIRIIVKRKGLKVLFFQNLLNILLIVKKIDGCSFETVAFLTVYIASILTERTVKGKFHVVRRISISS